MCREIFRVYSRREILSNYFIFFKRIIDAGRIREISASDFCPSHQKQQLFFTYSKCAKTKHKKRFFTQRICSGAKNRNANFSDRTFFLHEWISRRWLFIIAVFSQRGKNLINHPRKRTKEKKFLRAKDDDDERQNKVSE